MPSGFWSWEYASTKNPVSKDIPVQNIKSVGENVQRVGVFQCKISKSVGKFQCKYPESRGIPVQSIQSVRKFQYKVTSQ
jgi:hypothetical protein